ncbi:CHAT domain-containing protein, partial [Rhodococcus sp. O3]|uniref:CHAT domain-containing protein n=1 Tax=Rhodococcus sp. O3 TaxID=3404919 RepID=UPI003B675AA8
MAKVLARLLAVLHHDTDLDETEAAPDATVAETFPEDRILEAVPAPEPTTGTRTAYARLDAPDRVAPGGVFELDVGLAESPGHGVTSPHPLSVPDTEFTLTVTVSADGFEVLGGASLVRTILVGPDDPYTYDVIRLRAIDDDALTPARSILAVYAIEGRTIGIATRSVVVGDGPVPAEPDRTGVDWVLPTDPDTRPDLELVVHPGNDIGGQRLFWYFRSPHPTVGDGNFVAADLPATVATTVRQLLNGVEDRKSHDDLPYYLRGIGRRIADAIPDPVWQALKATADAVEGPPSVLLASADPYIPWELARIPWCDDDPPLLGAQTVIGRWPYLANGRSPAPAPRLELDSMAVVFGEYSGDEKLAEAAREAVHLRTHYAAHPVDARMSDILRCLDGTPRANVLHLAVHGNFDPTGLRDGIYLVDGKHLSPVSVEGVEESPVRLAFLNACQLAQGREVFGIYAGMAFALLKIRAEAVIAPLWEVDDAAARELATAFYPALFTDGLSPAAYLRGIRCRSVETSPAATSLAYIYFGHPLL